MLFLQTFVSLSRKRGKYLQEHISSNSRKQKCLKPYNVKHSESVGYLQCVFVPSLPDCLDVVYQIVKEKFHHI